MEALSGHQRFIEISAPGFPRLGYLAIDTTYMGASVGGVRIMPDVTAAEVSHMARTMSRKYLFCGIPMGGAKAGLILGADAACGRARALQAFGRALRPHIESGFWPGCDLGASMDDIRLILRGAGFATLQKDNIPSHKYTAWSIIHSIDAVLSRNGGSWSGCRMAIEGFGKVGGLVASMAHSRGALIVAISNIHGCLKDDRGLDVPLMLSLRSGLGEPFIRRCPGVRSLPKESVFSADCDIFVPAARCWSLDAPAPRMHAKAIVCAANVPMTRDTERFLFRKGIIIVPDSVANCGGVVGSTLARVMDDNAIDAILETRFQSRIHDILDSKAPPSDYLDGFIERRKKALASELAPRKRSRLDFLIGAADYHLIKPLFGRKCLESRLFPLQ